MLMNVIYFIDFVFSLIGFVMCVQVMMVILLLYRMEVEDFVIVGLDFVCGVFGLFVVSIVMYFYWIEVICLYFECVLLKIDKNVLMVDWCDGC